MRCFKIDRQTRASVRAALILAAASLVIGFLQGCVRAPTWAEALNIGMKIGQCVSDNVDFGKFIDAGASGDAAPDGTDAATE